jgi:hypothetical protein
MLDEKMRIRARPETKTLNLKELMGVLRSKDAKLWKNSEWMFDGEFRFLDGQPNDCNKIAFASFPRAGNTFLRKYCELLTGVQTGGDNTLHVNVILQLQGLKGEDIVDDTCWIVKTHSPYIMPESPKFTCNKMFCIVRNPLDCILSWLNLLSTANHNSKAPFCFAKEYPEWWEWWVKDCCFHLNNWFKVVMKDARMREVPIIFIRFEDLVKDPEPELNNLMRFFTHLDNLEGTNAQRRIKEVIAKGKSATQTYVLKDTTT